MREECVSSFVVEFGNYYIVRDRFVDADGGTTQ